MRYLLIIFLLAWVSFRVHGQQTQSLLITGEVNAEKTVSLEEIKTLPVQKLGDLLITNHAGEPRGTARDLMGIPIRELLKDLSYNTSSPRELSEFYFVFEAIDGYKVVFSWNELFNNPLGNSVYLIVSREGKKVEEMEDGLLLVCLSDEKTGRRQVKNLSRIVIHRASPSKRPSR